MSRLKTVSESALSNDTLSRLEGVRQGGKLADVYLQFTNSEPALGAYLQMEASLRAGSLGNVEVEAIKLFVSEQTGCEFCLSVHTMKARGAGLDATMQRSVRRGEPTGDARLDAILKLVARLFRTPGAVPAAELEAARTAGLDDTNLMDVVMAVSTIFFTNLANHVNDTRSPLPKAPSLTESAG